MTLTGSAYLVQLAALAVAFVGWSTIVVTLRRALGGEVSPLHMYFVRFFIEIGLAVATFGLLPETLSLMGMEETRIWRLSSGLAAFMFSAYLVALRRRRRRVTTGRVPFGTQLGFAISTLAVVAPWANTAGIGFHQGAAMYAFALTSLLVLGGWVFWSNLELFLGGASRRDRD
jgi:hypothetical protein